MVLLINPDTYSIHSADIQKSGATAGSYGSAGPVGPVGPAELQVMIKDGIMSISKYIFQNPSKNTLHMAVHCLCSGLIALHHIHHELAQISARGANDDAARHAYAILHDILLLYIKRCGADFRPILNYTCGLTALEYDAMLARAGFRLHQGVYLQPIDKSTADIFINEYPTQLENAKSANDQLKLMIKRIYDVLIRNQKNIDIKDIPMDGAGEPNETSLMQLIDKIKVYADLYEKELDIVKEKQGELINKNQEIKKLLDRISSIEQQLNAAQSAISKVENERTQLADELTAERAKFATERAALMQENKRLEDQIAKLTQSIKDCETQLSAVSARLNDASSENARLTQLNDDLQRSINVLNQQILDGTQRLQDLENQLQVLTTRLDEMTRAHNTSTAKIDEFERLIAQKQDFIDKQALIIQQYQDRIRELEADIRTSQDRRAESEAEIKSLKSYLQTAEASLKDEQQMVAQLRSQIDANNETISKLKQADLHHQTQLSDELTTERAKFEAERATLIQENKRLDDQIAKLTQSIKDAESQLSAVSTRIKDVSSDNTRLTQLNDDLQKSIAVLKQQQSDDSQKHSDHERRIQELEADIRTSQDRRAESEAEIKSLKSYLQTAEASLKDEQQMVAQLRSQIDANTQSISKLEQRIKIAESDVKSSDARVADLQALIERLNKERDDALAKVKSLEADTTSARSSYTTNLAELQRQIAAKNREIADGSRREDELRNRIKSIESIIDAKDRELARENDVIKYINDMTNEINTIILKYLQVQKGRPIAPHESLIGIINSLDAVQTKLSGILNDRIIKYNSLQTARSSIKEQADELDNLNNIMSDKDKQIRTLESKLKECLENLEKAATASAAATTTDVIDRLRRAVQSMIDSFICIKERLYKYILDYDAVSFSDTYIKNLNRIIQQLQMSPDLMDAAQVGDIQKQIGAIQTEQVKFFSSMQNTLIKAFKNIQNRLSVSGDGELGRFKNTITDPESISIIQEYEKVSARNFDEFKKSSDNIQTACDSYASILDAMSNLVRMDNEALMNTPVAKMMAMQKDKFIQKIAQSVEIYTQKVGNFPSMATAYKPTIDLMLNILDIIKNSKLTTDYGRLIEANELIAKHYKTIINLYEDMSGSVRVYVKLNISQDAINMITTHTGDEKYADDADNDAKEPAIDRYVKTTVARASDDRKRVDFSMSACEGIDDEKVRKSYIWHTSDLCKNTQCGTFYEVFPDIKQDNNGLTTFNNEDSFNRMKDTFNQVVDGYKCVIFVAGFSGSGKTFTLYGRGQTLGITQHALKFIAAELCKKYPKCKKQVNIEIEDIVDVYGQGNTEKDVKPISSDNFRREIRRVGKVGIPVEPEQINDRIRDITNYRLSQAGMYHIKPTPNNEESSRGHLVITYGFTLDGQSVGGKLIVVDMGGAENVNAIRTSYENTKNPNDFYFDKFLAVSKLKIEADTHSKSQGGGGGLTDDDKRTLMLNVQSVLKLGALKSIQDLSTANENSIRKNAEYIKYSQALTTSNKRFEPIALKYVIMYIAVMLREGNFINVSNRDLRDYIQSKVSGQRADGESIVSKTGMKEMMFSFEGPPDKPTKFIFMIPIWNNINVVRNKQLVRNYNYCLSASQILDFAFSVSSTR